MFREMRRRKQALERSECEEILKAAPRGVLSLLGDDGYPYGVPINFCYRDGKVYFHGAKVGHKIDAIEACDKVSLTVLDEGERHEGEWWMCFRSVICFGRIRKVEDPKTIERSLWDLAGKYFPEEVDTADDIRRNGPRVQVLELTIDHMSGKFVREK